MLVHIDKPDPFLVDLARVAFPGYHGRNYRIDVTDKPIDVTSRWSGGSRDYFTVIRLVDFKKLTISVDVGTEIELQPGLACVKCSLYRGGQGTALTIYVRPENVISLLPAVVDLSWAELVVLATRSLRPRKRYPLAKLETGISLELYENAHQSLVTRGFLTRRGVITAAGQNAIGEKSLRALRKGLTEAADA